MSGGPSEQTRRNRIAGARKAAVTRKTMRAFLERGEPIGPAPERGTARGDYSPAELIERIRAREGGAL